MAHLIRYCDDWLAKIVSFLMPISAKECKCMRQMDEKFFSQFAISVVQTILMNESNIA